MRVFSRCALRLLVGLVTGLLLSPVVAPSALLAQQEADDALADPVAYGAWLYEGNCVRCHGAYETERIGSGLDKDELHDKIYGDDRDSCRVTWGQSNGGPLGAKDVRALVAYILEWEELGGPPDLPELPPQPTATPSPTPTASAETEPAPTPSPTPDPAVTALQPYFENDEVAHGAWLYSVNCQRCHGAYSLARMGSNVTDEYVRETIEQGKTGTSMPAFGRRWGGDLRISEVNAIVAYAREYERLDGPPELPTYVLTMTQRAELENAIDGVSIADAQLPSSKEALAYGEQIYAQYCAVCHGAEGEGGIGKALAKEWGAVQADMLVLSTVANGVPGTEMIAWSTDGGGPLKRDEILSVAAYVLALPHAGTQAALSTTAVAATTPAGVPGCVGVSLVMLALALITAAIRADQDAQ